jgi:hypothetical protein
MKLHIRFEQLARIDAGNVEISFKVEVFHPRPLKPAGVELKAAQQRPGRLQIAAVVIAVPPGHLGLLRVVRNSAVDKTGRA